MADHVAAMLTWIPRDDELGSDLRFLALVHDSFKSEVRPHEPWSTDNDHAALARRFAESYTTDERLLTTLELHDEPYCIWRTGDQPEQALRALLDRSPDPRLFARFVELDAANEGKDLTFLWWFRRELARRGQLPTHPAADMDGRDEDVVYVKAFATTPQQQPAVAKLASPDAALVDVQLPDTDGLVLARTLRETGNGLRVILTSTDPTLVPEAALAESPALAVVPKAELAVTDLAF